MYIKRVILIIALLLLGSIALMCSKENPTESVSELPFDTATAINTSSTPPQFDSESPCKQGWDISATQTITLPFTAFDTDPGDVVTLRSIELMPGATMTPPTPVSGNPVSSTFSWTPTANQQGWFMLSVGAEDLAGNRTPCMFSIDVGPPPPPPPGGTQGCTPGAWKNRLLNIGEWGPTGYSPGQTVQSVWSAASAYPSLASASLLQALSFPGGSGVTGMAQNLLRAAVAALLNASHPGVNYKFTEDQVLSGVNTRLASGNRNTMEDAKNILDLANNGGCSL